MAGFRVPAVTLARFREMLRLYCHALTERNIELQDLRQLVERNIGWSKDDVATTDGATIFLPTIVQRFAAETTNFDYLKVMVTQQAGHIEFGSFAFRFDREATMFDDLRSKIQSPPAYHDHDHGHEGHHDHSGTTELTRYFRLFPSRRLARDIFAIIETGRVEARIMREYPGIAKTYAEMRACALQVRPELTLLPAREALLEFMLRISLGQRSGLKVPSSLLDIAREVFRILCSIFEFDSTVEDAAEATLRVYCPYASIQNQYLEFEDFSLFDARPTVANVQDSQSQQNRLLVSEKFLNDAPQSRFILLPGLRGKEREYRSPPSVDHRGDFQPELAQLLSFAGNAREQRKALTAEELADLLRSQRTPKRGETENEAQDDPQTNQMLQNLMRELDRRDPKMQSVARLPSGRAEDEGGPLSANQPNTFIYDEWNVFEKTFRRSWCRVYEKLMLPGELSFYRDTLITRKNLLKRIRNEFEQVMPEIYRKEKRLPDGTEHDLDAAIEALTSLRVRISPSEKIFWRQHKLDRDVAVAFLLDMSGSTGEAMTHVTETALEERSHRRIIDIEKEAIVLMSDALETIGDRYGVYGFSGHGRDNVEFFVIKGLDEEFTVEVAKRFGRIGPLHATRMGPAIRHTAMRLTREQAHAKYLFLISDGRPQDRGYSQESSEKEYAVQDTRMALFEARRQGIHPFCLTVDKEGNDYLGRMMGDFSYEVLSDISLLPLRLPQLYRKLTM